MGSQADSSAEFCSPSFDRALAELAMPELDEHAPPPLCDGRASSIRSLPNDEPTPSPDWPDEDELAAFDEFEAEQSRKRKREEEGPESDVEPRVGATSSTKDISQVDPMYEDHPAYVASKFGGIGAYLRHKREKL